MRYMPMRDTRAHTERPLARASPRTRRIARAMDARARVPRWTHGARSSSSARAGSRAARLGNAWGQKTRECAVWVTGDGREPERAYDGVVDDARGKNDGDEMAWGDGIEGGDAVDDDALLVDAAENPYFNDAFREALEEARRRQSEERMRNKAKIDDEVSQIMAKVRAERAMRAAAMGQTVEEGGEGGSEPAKETEPEPVTPAAEAPPTPSSPPQRPMVQSTPTQVVSGDSQFTDLLERHILEMTETSKNNIAKLTNAKAAVEESLANERVQLARLEMLMDRVKKESRYRRADEALRRRKQQ